MASRITKKIRMGPREVTEIDYLPEWAQQLLFVLAECPGYGCQDVDEHIVSFSLLIPRNRRVEWFAAFHRMKELAEDLVPPI